MLINDPPPVGFLKIMTASIAQQKIRIRLKAFDRRMLDLSCDKIIQTADTTSASAIGPVSYTHLTLPTS